MARKKEKQKTIINIGEMKCEVDYDKLADAIVKAQAAALEQAQAAALEQAQAKTDDENKKRTRGGSWKQKIAVFHKKKDADSTTTTDTFAIINSLFFRIASILSFLLAFVIAGVIIYGSKGAMVWQGWQIFWNIVMIVMLSAGWFFVTLFFILFWKAANEIQKEKDRNFILAVFSGIVSFSALIVAVVALLREVH